jgi:hypothetical protein
MWVDCDGFDHPFDAPATPSLHAGSRHRAIKTQGTNCAFRRDSLLEIGGFDEGYAFYLDEADVNLRLAAMGGQTAIVPDAVVHHGFAASARRRADRTPTDLTQIGQSLALFTAKHGQNPDALGTHIAEQRARLIRHMIDGTLEPRDIRRLMAGLHRGVKSAKPQATPAPLAPSASPFSALPNTGPREGHLLVGTEAERNHLELQALDAQRSGKIVTLLLLARGIKAHKHHFTEQGWWEQSGGRFGRAFRVGERFVWQSAKVRHKTEAARLSAFRPLSATAPE